MEKDVRRYLTKHTSMSKIKVDHLPKCEADISRILVLIEEGIYFSKERNMSNYEQGIAYFFGVGEIRNEDMGLRKLKEAVWADEFDMDAANIYGFACYHYSLDCEDVQKKQWYEKQAVKYWKLAAKASHAEAIFNLAVCYLEGKCLEENQQQGLLLLAKAVELGHPRAVYYLKEYSDEHGLGDPMPRENHKTKAQCIQEVMEVLKKEAKTLPKGQQIYLVGMFNDIYLEQGYKWVKNGRLGWICSKDGGETYLISESELGNISLE